MNVCNREVPTIIIDKAWFAFWVSEIVFCAYSL